MKKLLILGFFATILAISCKKEEIAPIYKTPLPTTKSFKAIISFKQDSVGTYYISNNNNLLSIQIFITDIPVPPDGGVNTNGHVIYSDNSGGCSGCIGSYTQNSYPTYTTSDMNKVFNYYIIVSFHAAIVGGGVRGIRYCKPYTFHEGDNGIINFNTLP